MSGEIVKELKEDPIFNVSLSSKELFHSNFWEWLFKRSPEYIKIFFPEIESERIDMDDENAIRREQGHRDITIWIKDLNKAYVIENKFKSVPNKKQLENYENDLKEFEKGTVTGIIKPSFIESLEGWEFISYSDISKGILRVSAQLEKEETFEKALIDKYAKMIEELTAYIINQTENERTQEKWSMAVDKDSELLRMDDVIRKLKASELENFLSEKKIFGQKDIAGYEGIVESSYSDKQPIVDIRYVSENKDDISNLSVIGVQIQGLQFRRCVQIERDLDSNEMHDLFEKVKRVGWFEEYDKENRFIFHKRTSMKPRKDENGKDKEYNKYSTKSYTFLYQYFNIKDGKSFEELERMIMENMEEAKKALPEINKLL